MNEDRIFYEDLPRWESGTNIGKIKWKLIHDYPLRFSYNGEIYTCFISYNANGNYRKIIITYKDHVLSRNSNTIYKISPSDILGINNNKQYKSYKYEIGEVIKKDNLDITIIGRYRKQNKNKTKTYLIKCNNCGFDSSKRAYRFGNEISYDITEDNLRELSKCPCCYGRITQPGINDVATLLPEVVKYFHIEEETKRFSPSSKYKITCVCPYCKSVKKNKITINQLCKLKHISCVCNRTISLPERVMYHVLNASQIVDGNFIYQYKPTWCVFEYNGSSHYGIYDFYCNIDDKRILIEMDGAFHYQKSYKDKAVPQRIIDLNKDILSLENGYTLIRIDCRYSTFEYIKSSIIKSIDKHVLDGIDWEQIEKLSFENLCKTICEDYEENKLRQDVMKYLEYKYHFSRSNIISNLHKGNKFGWCDYNNKPQWRKVYQFDVNGNLIQEFESCNQAMRETGITDLNQILLGKIKQKPPFIWSYSNKMGEIDFDRIGNPCRKNSVYKNYRGKKI